VGGFAREEPIRTETQADVCLGGRGPLPFSHTSRRRIMRYVRLPVHPKYIGIEHHLHRIERYRLPCIRRNSPLRRDEPRARIGHGHCGRAAAGGRFEHGVDSWRGGCVGRGVGRAGLLSSLTALVESEVNSWAVPVTGCLPLAFLSIGSRHRFLRTTMISTVEGRRGDHDDGDSGRRAPVGGCSGS
jgi:hypothetical protein